MKKYLVKLNNNGGGAIIIAGNYICSNDYKEYDDFRHFKSEAYRRNNKGKKEAYDLCLE